MPLKIDTSQFNQLAQLTPRVLDDLVQDAFDFYKAQTPVGKPSTWKTPRAPRGYVPGNARRSTRLRGNTIEGVYPYAERLEDGWSRQAPDGMSQPTIEHVQRVLFPQAIRRINSGN
jgi:hypothetical protein